MPSVAGYFVYIVVGLCKTALSACALPFWLYLYLVFDIRPRLHLHLFLPQNSIRVHESTVIDIRLFSDSRIVHTGYQCPARGQAST